MDARDHPTTADFAAHQAHDNTREIARLYELMELQTLLVLAMGKIMRALTQDIQPRHPERILEVIDELDRVMDKLKSKQYGRHH